MLTKLGIVEKFAGVTSVCSVNAAALFVSNC